MAKYNRWWQCLLCQHVWYGPMPRDCPQCLKLDWKCRHDIRKKLTSTYSNIKCRCNHPRTHGYEYYGGRGIKCNITIDDLQYLFLRDRGWLLQSPSIDRIDTAGHYSRNNCRFIEKKDNCCRKKKSL